MIRRRVLTSVIAYSILETAKANELNPEKYLMHIFTVLPDRFAKDPNADIGICPLGTKRYWSFANLECRFIYRLRRFQGQPSSLWFGIPLG